MLLFWEILLFLEPHVANVKSYHRTLENLRWNFVFVQDSKEFLTQTLEKPPYGLIPIIVRVSNLGRTPAHAVLKLKKCAIWTYFGLMWSQLAIYGDSMAIKWPSGRICTKKADSPPQIHQNSQKSAWGGLSWPLLKHLWVTDDIGKFNVKNWSFHHKCLEWTNTSPNTYHKPMGHVMPQVLDSSSLFKCHILWHIIEIFEIICHIHDVSWVWQLKKWPSSTFLW